MKKSLKKRIEAARNRKTPPDIQKFLKYLIKSFSQEK